MICLKINAKIATRETNIRPIPPPLGAGNLACVLRDALLLRKLLTITLNVRLLRRLFITTFTKLLPSPQMISIESVIKLAINPNTISAMNPSKSFTFPLGFTPPGRKDKHHRLTSRGYRWRRIRQDVYDSPRQPNCNL